jgi:hypothetical protein
MNDYGRHNALEWAAPSTFKPWYTKRRQQVLQMSQHCEGPYPLSQPRFRLSSTSSSRHSSSGPSSSRFPSLRPLSPSPDFPPAGKLGSLPPSTSMIKSPMKIKQEQVDTPIKLEPVDSVLPVRSCVALSTEVIEISSDSDDEPRVVVKPAPHWKSQKTSKRKTGHSSQIQVTRQQWVNRIVNLESIPSSFDISENEVVGYLIDTDTVEYDRWKRAEGTMKGIGRLKHEVTFSLSSSVGCSVNDKFEQSQDSWGGGTAGSINPRDCPEVFVFGPTPIRCQRASHECQGTYGCEFLDPDLRQVIRRTDCPVDREIWWEKEREQEAAQETSPATNALK